MLKALIYILLQTALGFLIFPFFDPQRKFKPLEKIIGSVFLGLFFCNYFVLLFALFFKSLNFSILFFFLICSISLLVFRKNLKENLSVFCSLSFQKEKKVIVAIFFIIFFYFLHLNFILWHNPFTDSLSSPIPEWGDTAFHLSLIEVFAEREPFSLSHPLFANTPLTYPFLVDFISATLRKLGENQIVAFKTPMFLFGFLVILFLYSFAKNHLGSKKFAILVLILILFGSGFGILNFFKDCMGAFEKNGPKGILKTLISPPKLYTFSVDFEWREKEGKMVWLVPIISFFSHQRSFSIGMSVFFFILFGIFYYSFEKEFWRYGILAGLLPFSHSHSFLALFFLMSALFWFFLKNWRSWILFAILTVSLASIQILYFFSNPYLKEPFFRENLGWMSCEKAICDTASKTLINIFSFWIENFGIIFLCWLGVLIFYPLLLKNNIIKEEYLPYLGASVVLFLMPNLFLFQPWSFDNGKILFYWWILAIVFSVGPILNFFYQKNLIFKFFGSLLFFFSFAAGIIDFSTKLINIKTYNYQDSIKIYKELGFWMKKNLPKSSTILAAPNTESVVAMIGGKSMYFGYEGWLWSEGLDYKERKIKAKKILNGNLKIACQEKIDYILLDKNLINYFSLKDITEILKNTTIVFEKKEDNFDVKLLKINCY
jgi:hypothetical protein